MAQGVRTVNQPVQPGRDVVVGYEETVVVPGRLKRISWGAIAAGVVLALVLQITLNLLGLSLGVNTINPATEAQAVDSGLGTAAVIWIAASILISLFAGGWVAGYLAGIPDDMDGVLHGLVVWAIVSLLSLFFLTSTVGSIISGVTNALGNVVSGAAQVVADVAPEAVGAIQDAAPEMADSLGLEGATFAGIEEEINAMVNQAVAPAADDPGAGTTDQAVQPANAQEVVDAVRQLIVMEATGTVDRQEVINVIAARTNLTEAEAEQTLARWEASIQQARVQVTESVEQTAQQIADTVALLAGVLFAAMVIGAFAAGAGGLVGAPTRDDLTPATTATTTTHSTG